jgi:beta-glucosidase
VRARWDGRFTEQGEGYAPDRGDFGFYDNRGKFVVEPGRIDVYAGSSSKADLTKSFTVRK